MSVETLQMKSPFLRRALVATVLAVGVAAPSARSPLSAAPQSGGQASARSGLILGRVVDGSSNRPIAGATVVMVRDPVAGRPGDSTQVLTGGDGYFLFRDLPAGDYAFRCLAAGYLVSNGAGMNRPNGPSRPVSLADGQKVDDVVVRMWKAGVVTGEVVDDHGEPLEGIQVSLLKIDVFAGRRRLIVQRTGSTNDLGAYRFAGLVPGDYAVCALFSRHVVPIVGDGSGGSGYRMGDLVLMSASGGRNVDPAPDENGHLAVFRNTCYPAASNVQAASPITVESGQERTSVGLTVGLIPTATVRGAVVGPPGRIGGLMVRLVTVGTDDSTVDNGIDAAYTTTGPSGAFGFVGVPAGSYTLNILPSVIFRRQTITSDGEVMLVVGAGGEPNQPGLWAASPLEVGDEDVNGVVLVLREGLRASGQIAFDGTSERPTGDRLTRIAIGFVDLSGGEASSSYFPRGGFERDGRFALTGMVPGRYLLRVSGEPTPWVLKSIVAHGRDVSDEPLELTGGDVTGIVVTMTDRPSLLSGYVRDDAGAPDLAARVIVFPSDRPRSSQTVPGPRRGRSASVSRAGEYSFANLPAGDYYVVAVDDRLDVDAQDPRTLEALARSATKVTVRDGEKRTQDLKTAPIR